MMQRYPTFLILIYVFCLGYGHAGHLAAQVRSNPKATASKISKKADAYYRDQQYSEAANLYRKALKIDSNSVGLKIKLGKSLYKTTDFEESYKAFKAVPLTSLDSETRYEFGQTALRAQDFKSCLKTFQTIPKGHPLFDLARFHGAICAANSSEYQLALKLMQEAVVLPSKLVSSKRAFEKQMANELTNSQNKKDERRKIKKFKNKNRPRPGSKDRNTYTMTEEVTLPNISFSRHTLESPKGNLGSADVGLRFTRGQHAFTDEDRDVGEIGLTVKSDIFHQFQTPSGIFGLALWSNLEFEKQNLDGQLIPLLPNDFEELSLLIRKENDFGESDKIPGIYSNYQKADLTVTSASVGGAPNFRINNDLWLLAGGELTLASINFNDDYTYSNYKAITGLIYSGKKIKAALIGEYIDTGVLNVNIKNAVRGSFYLSYWLSSKVKFGTHMQAKQYIYYDDVAVDGPEVEYRLLTDGHLIINKYVSLSLAAHMRVLSGDQIFGITSKTNDQENQEKQDVTLDRTFAGFSSKGKFQLGPWFTMEVSANFQQRFHFLIKPESSGDLLRDIGPDSITYFGAALWYNYKF